MKNIKGVYSAPQGHWVGDGFPVRSLFSYHSQGADLSPFLLLDYAGPARFEATEKPRGVGAHPHRGFETVTIVYQGEVAHRDSTGAGGTIGAGDVQWMTAASGIVHDEFHSEAFTAKGGTLEMVQLWVNLPARDKWAKPGYQSLLNAEIPSVALPEAAGQVRVIAGSFQGMTGPARTFTPINVWDIRLKQSCRARFEMPEGHTLSLVVLHGAVRVNGSEILRDAQSVLLDRAGSGVELQAEADSTILLLGGAPIDEPLVGHGPFVMNTRQEIHDAISDYQRGSFLR